MIWSSRQRDRRLLVSLVATVLVAQFQVANAQYEDLNPKLWFPLQLENYWHYSDGNLINTETIVTSAKDSVVAGRRWVRFDYVYCFGPSCPSLPRWYALTDDNFILYGLSETDTVLATQPRSYLEATSASDTTLFIDQQYDCGGNPRFPFVDTYISEIPTGSAADSTNLLLSVERGYLCSTKYIYKIGREIGVLKGALVNGLEWGDTSKIYTVLSSESDPGTSGAAPNLEIYPNPSTGEISVSIESAPPGRHSISVFELSGKLLDKYSVAISGSGTTSQVLSLDRYPAGLYLVTLSGSSGAIIARTVAVHI